MTKRLAAAASAVRDGSCAADVGCDHGKLAAFFIVSGKCPHVFAVDVSEASLEKARALFLRLGITGQAETVLGGGLAGLDPRRIDDVVVAGLGFDVTAGILSSAPWLRDGAKQLVLVPSSHHAKLRRHLYRNGYEIRRETAVFENGHIYTVITAGYTGKKEEISPFFAAVGKVPGGAGEREEYLAYTARHYCGLIQSMAHARIRDSQKIREVEEVLRMIGKIREAESWSR